MNSCVVASPPMSRVRYLLQQLLAMINSTVRNQYEDSPFRDHTIDSLGDAVSMVIKTEVAEQHRAREQKSSRVGLVLALNIKTNVSASGLENSYISAHVAARNNTGSTDQSSTNVGQDTTVQVGHDHDVELLRSRHTLHTGVVHNHVVGLEGRVLGGSLLESASEQTVGQLHDVGLVDTGDLLAVVSQREGEGELGNALRLGAGDDLERLDDAGHALVLEAAVFTLGVFSDDA